MKIPVLGITYNIRIFCNMNESDNVRLIYVHFPRLKVDIKPYDTNHLFCKNRNTIVLPYLRVTYRAVFTHKCKSEFPEPQKKSMMNRILVLYPVHFQYTLLYPEAILQPTMVLNN